MTHPLHTRLLILGIALATTVACTTPNETCDPMQDERCVCDDPNDADTCRIDDSKNTSETNNDTNRQTTCAPPNAINDDGVAHYRFLFIEDLSSDNLNGDTPGADIDAIALQKDCIEYYAAVVEDFNVGGANNAFTDISQVLGPPDSNCTEANFTALGGSINDGYVVVSFGDDVTIESGDRIVFYELGPTVCPGQPGWLDDELWVGIMVSLWDDNETIGTIGPHHNVIEVP